MKFIFPLIRACVWANVDFHSASSSSFTSTFPQTIPVVEGKPRLAYALFFVCVFAVYG